MFHLSTAHMSIQCCIPICKWLYWRLVTYKGKQLKWMCHNDATIPKFIVVVSIMPVVNTFQLVTYPSENCCELKITIPRK